MGLCASHQSGSVRKEPGTLRVWSEYPVYHSRTPGGISSNSKGGQGADGAVAKGENSGVSGGLGEWRRFY